MAYARALACVFYHRDNIIEVEAKIFQISNSPKYKNLVLQGSCLGLSWNDTLKLDAEYQACILAMRRCLEYLVSGLHSYSKNHYNSFRTYQEALNTFVKIIIRLQLRFLKFTNLGDQNLIALWRVSEENLCEIKYHILNM